MKKIIYMILAIALLGTVSSCSKDALDPTLEQEKAVETSINSVEDLKGIIHGMYNRMTGSAYYGRDLIIFNEVRSDNTFSDGNSGRFITAAAMQIGVADAYARDTWSDMYRVVASANILIGTDPTTITGDAAEINHILGQAYAIRALAHFDALKLYGQQHVSGGTLGVPYVTTYKGEDLTPARNSVSEVKSMIEADLAQAVSLMSASLNDGSKQFMTTYGATALQARVALYFGDWNTAKTAAQSVVNSGAYSIANAADLANTFLIDGASNSIFELAYSGTDNANINGLQQIYRGDSYGDIRVLDDLLAIFDAGDVRAAPDMIGYEGTKLRNIGKYPSLDYSDNVSLIRYEEVVLILAEAMIETGDAGALAVLNMVPAKRGAVPYTAATKANVMLERRKELCFEGFRFNDLARTQSDIPLVSAFEQTHGGPAYGDFKYAFPIPRVELNANSNMVQNVGY